MTETIFSKKIEKEVLEKVGKGESTTEMFEGLKKIFPQLFETYEKDIKEAIKLTIISCEEKHQEELERIKNKLKKDHELNECFSVKQMLILCKQIDKIFSGEEK